MHYEARVITLDPHSRRFSQFQQANEHISWRIFEAVRGAALSRTEILARNLVAAKCLDSGKVPVGQIGAMASHFMLWQEAAKSRTPLLILEDDVFTHPALHKVISALSSDQALDLIFFGVNTDTVLATLSPEGVREFSYFEDRYPPTERIKSILAGTDPSRLTLRRMLNGFGLCCYLVTPQGADKIIQTILPLRSDHIPLEGIPGASISGISNDRRLNALFPALNAYVCRPFLAWTPNTDSSTRAPSEQR